MQKSVIANGLAATTTTGTGGTVLMNWAKLEKYNWLLFSLQNNDGSINVTMTVETSQDGSRPDIENNAVLITPGAQGSVQIGPDQMRRWFRLIGTAASGTPAVTYEVLGGE